MIHFAEISGLLSHLRDESMQGERFATRFILVQGCQAWDDVVHRLQNEVERVVRLSEFCSGPDVFPSMAQLESHLRTEASGSRSVLVTPLAECIRLDPESADVIRQLAEWPTGRISRIYIPLLAAEELFYPEIHRVFRYRNRELPQLWSFKGEGNAEIIVAPFSANLRGRQVAKGIKEYLALWETGSVRKVWLVTAMAAWLPIRLTKNECSVRLYQSSFDYVRQNTECDELQRGWGIDDQWEWLAGQVQESEGLDTLAGRLLNVVGYHPDHLFTLWNNLDREKRWLVWLWSKKRCDSTTYLYHVLLDNERLDDFGNSVYLTIFAVPRSVAFSRERKRLLKHLGASLPPGDFWQRYRAYQDPIDQVAVLTDLSVPERQELVTCAGRLLDEHPRELWWEYLESSFPELAWYLHPAVTADEFANRYFVSYNRCRVKDRADEALAMLVDEWSGRQLLWDYPGRSDQLAKLRGSGARILWSDAMGVEWTGLLSRLLTRGGQVECEVSIARACLPTTTDANKEWEAGEDVVRGLDDIAHHYAYRFPESFLKAIDVIRSVADRALTLLLHDTVVVVTSDHGLSRFAATGSLKIEAPAGAQVDTRGRFALLQEDCYDIGNCGMWVMEKGRAYLLTHGRFKGGAASHGEVHSGATPEECLTPVIVIRKTSGDAPLRFALLTTRVNLTAQGEGMLTVRCNRKVTGVELWVAGKSLQGQSGAEYTWSFVLRGWKAGSYTGRLYSANQLVMEIDFEVIRGIIQNDLRL